MVTGVQARLMRLPPTDAKVQRSTHDPWLLQRRRKQHVCTLTKMVMFAAHRGRPTNTIPIPRISISPITARRLGRTSWHCPRRAARSPCRRCRGWRRPGRRAGCGACSPPARRARSRSSGCRSTARARCRTGPPTPPAVGARGRRRRGRGACQ